MAYNEPVMLPIWLRYYSNQVGADNCYVIDHGSDDFSTRSIQNSCSILRIPRSVHDVGKIAKIVSKLCAGLLNYYSHVIYVDSDEFIVAEPEEYLNLIDFCERKPPGVLTMFGMDVIHDFDAEPDMDFQRKILGQRMWARPSAFLCKPSLIDREVKWSEGFHRFDGGSIFSNIYLFHLALCDKRMMIERQRKRNKAVPVDNPGSHHAALPDDVERIVRSSCIDGADRFIDVDLRSTDPRRQAFESSLFADDDSRSPEDRPIWHFDPPTALWKIPDRFKLIF